MLDGIGLEGLLIGREGAAAVSRTACAAPAFVPNSASGAASKVEGRCPTALRLPGVYQEAERRIVQRPRLACRAPFDPYGVQSSLAVFVRHSEHLGQLRTIRGAAPLTSSCVRYMPTRHGLLLSALRPGRRAAAPLPRASLRRAKRRVRPERTGSGACHLSADAGSSPSGSAHALSGSSSGVVRRHPRRSSTGSRCLPLEPHRSPDGGLR